MIKYYKNNFVVTKLFYFFFLIYKLRVRVWTKFIFSINIFLFLFLFTSLSISLFFNSYLFASNIGIDLLIDRNEFYENEAINFQVKVNGKLGSISDPIFKNLEDFEGKPENRGSSTQMQIINGKVSKSVIYNYEVFPKKTGLVFLGPAIVKISGNQYVSNKVQLKILKENESSSDVASEKKYFVTAEVTEKNPIVNQQIIYSFNFYRKVQVVNANVSLPEFNNLWSEKFSDQNEYEKFINGVRYLVTEIKVALFPSEIGKIIIPGAILNGEALIQERNERRRGNPRDLFDSFFNDDSFFGGFAQRKTIKLKADDIELNVQPLPLKKNKDNYEDNNKNISNNIAKINTSLVGKFNIKADLSKTDLKVGESTTLTIEVVGDGNLRDLTLTSKDLELNKNLKLYDDNPEFSINRVRNKIIEKKIFKKAIVPLKEGKIVLPAIQIEYYDPELKNFQKLTTPSFLLLVSPSDSDEVLPQVIGQNGKGQNKVKILAQDIMPIKLHFSGFFSEKPEKKEKLILIFIVVFLLIVYLVMCLIKLHRKKIYGDSNYLRRNYAYKNFFKNLKKINNVEMISEISLVLRSYVGDKLGIDGKSLTSLDVKRKLTNYKLTLTLLSDLEKFLKDCEISQYGGKNYSYKEKVEFKQKAIKLVKQMEKEI